MPKTMADEWFEDYLRERGVEPGDHEPDPRDLGGARPDYLPTAEGRQIACEVKQFGKGSKLERRLAKQSVGVIPGTELYGPIRNQVKDAAKQLKSLAGKEIPLVVVLANPEGVCVDLSVQNVIAALYGNPQWTMQIDLATGAAVDDGRLELGRDGKLTNDHAYLSAVALLRRRELAFDARDEILAELRKGYDEEAKTAEERQERAAAAIEEMERHDLPDGHYFYVEVIETLSEEAVPLPESWFSGERDRRWRCNADGYYELVHGTPDLVD
jgi:hypothetical protein